MKTYSGKSVHQFLISLSNAASQSFLHFSRSIWAFLRKFRKFLSSPAEKRCLRFLLLARICLRRERASLESQGSVTPIQRRGGKRVMVVKRWVSVGAYLLQWCFEHWNHDVRVRLELRQRLFAAVWGSRSEFQLSLLKAWKEKMLVTGKLRCGHLP